MEARLNFDCRVLAKSSAWQLSFLKLSFLAMSRFFLHGHHSREPYF